MAARKHAARGHGDIPTENKPKTRTPARNPQASAPTQRAASKSKSAALNIPKPNGKYRQYTDADKATALIALEANGGNVKGTARALNIPEPTLRLWANDYHTTRDVAKIQDEKRLDFTALLEAEINAALGAMNDKRDDGSYSDMARTVGIFIDKLELLRGNATARHEITGKVSLSDLLRGDGD